MAGISVRRRSRIRFATTRQAFEWAVTALARIGQLRTLRIAIGALCISTAALGLVMQFHPAAPPTIELRIVHGVVLASALVVGVWWIAGTGLTHRSAVLFAVWADLAIAVNAVVLATPAARICTTVYMSLIGVFIALLLGIKPLLIHCAACAALIAALVAWAVVTHTGTGSDLFLYWSPAVSTVVVLPLMIQIVIEGSRRSIRRAGHLAMTDPLTGLWNRRGLLSAVAERIRTDSSPSTVCVCVCDVDAFKRINDEHGHDTGDRILVGMARSLETCLRPGDLAARIGGDELALVAFCHPADGAVRSLQTRLQDIVELALSDLTATASIGIAAQSKRDRHFNLDDLLRQADRAMYEVKRSGGGGVVVFDDLPSAS